MKKINFILLLILLILTSFSFWSCQKDEINFKAIGFFTFGVSSCPAIFRANDTDFEVINGTDFEIAFGSQNEVEITYKITEQQSSFCQMGQRIILIKIE